MRIFREGDQFHEGTREFDVLLGYVRQHVSVSVMRRSLRPFPKNGLARCGESFFYERRQAV